MKSKMIVCCSLRDSSRPPPSNVLDHSDHFDAFAALAFCGFTTTVIESVAGDGLGARDGKQ